MRRAGKIVLIVFGVLLLAALIVPLIVPIPALEDTVPPRELADPDSQFVEIDDLDVLQTIQKAIKKAETLNEVRSSYLR